METTEGKDAGFSGYEVYFKNRIYTYFFYLYLLKYPFSNSKIKAKVGIVYMKKTNCNDHLDSKEGTKLIVGFFW